LGKILRKLPQEKTKLHHNQSLIHCGDYEMRQEKKGKNEIDITVNQRVLGSSPRGGAKKKGTGIACPFAYK
jgi:hypothetical protein